MATVCQAEIWTLNDILEATCRVAAGSAYGSGTCIKHHNGKYYILTNAHVVRGTNQVKLEFFKNGHKTLPMPARVVYRKLLNNASIDFAIVSIDEKYFGNYPPRIAKIATKSQTADRQYIKSAGCPSARWASAWEGTIERHEGNRIIFYPPPVGGQSGSGLYIDNNGQTLLKGVITWKIGSGGRNPRTGYLGSRGAAIRIDKLYDVINGQVDVEPLPDNYMPVSFSKTPSFARTGHYAFGDDSKFYKITDEHIDSPSHVRIIAYYVGIPASEVSHVQCPDCNPRSRRPFSKQPNNPYNNIKPIPPRNPPGRTPNDPYDFLPNPDTPDVPEPDFLPDYSKELEKTQEQNALLTEENTKLTKQIEGLNGQIASKTGEITTLVKKLGELELEYGSSKKNNDGLLKDISELKLQIVDEQTQIQALVNNSASVNIQLEKTYTESQRLELELQTIQNKIETHKQELQATAEAQTKAITEKLEEQTNQKNYFGISTGILGVGLLGFLLKTFYSGPTREKVKERVDNIQDRVEDRVQDIAGEGFASSIRNILEAVEGRISNRIDLLTNNMSESINHVNNKVDNIHTKIENTTINPGYTQQPAPVTPTPIPVPTIDNSYQNEEVLSAIDDVHDKLGSLGRELSKLGKGFNRNAPELAPIVKKKVRDM